MERVQGDSAPRRAGREAAGLALLAVAPLLPFLDAAVSIDAPVFLAVTRQILAAPGDPFGFEMIWDPSSPRAAEFNLNPPLLSYYLAPAVALFGEREVWLHAWLLPFPVLAALSFLGIARRTGGPALAPAALLVTTPAFLVLATTLMLDVPTLACLLFAVYALLRGAEGEGAGWPLVAGLATAAAGLCKYVGMSALPLAAAGVALLYRRRLPAALLVVGIPLVAWALWGAYTARLYGRVHFLTGVEFASERRFVASEFWNHLCSIPIYYGAALLFPIFAWVRALLRREPRPEIDALGLVLGTAAVVWVLPEGFPTRRHPIGIEEAVLGAAGFAGAFALWLRCLAAARRRARALDLFLALWLLGFLVFSALVNWHVNAADALLAAPPLLLLLYRTPALRPPPRVAAAFAAASLAMAVLLAWAESEQAGAYRSAARQIAASLAGEEGARWYVGTWGFQYYLERDGFRGIPPRSFGEMQRRERRAPGDWIASARNTPQMDEKVQLAGLRFRGLRTWKQEFWLPLRTNHVDAGAGFYSHRLGYVPFAWYAGPLEEIGLARIESLGGSRAATAAPR